MTSNLIQMREAVLAAIVAFQASPGFVYNAFVAASTHVPYSRIEEQPTQTGKLWVIGDWGDDTDRKTRHDPSGNVKPLVSRELAVVVAYQQSNVMPDDKTTIDNLCCLIEQLRDAVKNFNYQTPDLMPLWVRNEVLKDENNVPFHYYMVREANVFESYFTAHFICQHQ